MEKETKKLRVPKEDKNKPVPGNEMVETLILLDKDSEIKLTAKQGKLKCFDVLNNKNIEIKFKKSKDNLIWNLLDGYQMIKPLYKNQRLIAIEVDDKFNAVVLNDTKLKAFEKKHKKYFKVWSMVHKNSFGIK